MTLRDRESVIPEMLVIVGSRADAAALSPLAALTDDVRPTLVATGPDPMLVDEILDELGTPAGRILLPEATGDDGGHGDPVPPALELTALLPRLDDLVAQTPVEAVVVRGGTAAALAGAQVATWRGVPLIALAGPVACRAEAANHAMITELAGWQTSGTGATPFPTWLDLLVHQRVTDSAGRADPAQRVIGMPADRLSRGIAPGLSA